MKEKSTIAKFIGIYIGKNKTRNAQSKENVVYYSFFEYKAKRQSRRVTNKQTNEKKKKKKKRDKCYM